MDVLFSVRKIWNKLEERQQYGEMFKLRKRYRAVERVHVLYRPALLELNVAWSCGYSFV